MTENDANLMVPGKAYVPVGSNVEQHRQGGEGSGNFGHEGRPGEVGGSGPGGASVNARAGGKSFEVHSGETVGEAYKRSTGSDLHPSYTPAIEPNLTPKETRNEKSASSGNRWKYTTLEASTGRDYRADQREPGFKFKEPELGTTDIVLHSPKDVKYDNPNKNTTTATATIKAGIYNEPGSRSLQSHGINWDKVSEVSGSTFEVKELLKEKGFKYSDKTKSWVHPDRIDPEARAGLTS